MEATETTPRAPEGDPFAGGGAPPEPVPQPAPEPEQLPPAPAPEPGPDLSEQDQALAAKLAAQQAAEPEYDPGYQPEPEYADYGHEGAGDEVFWDEQQGAYVDGQGYPVPEDQLEPVDGYEPEQAQGTGDPRLDALYGYAQHLETQERDRQLLELAEANPDLRSDEILDAVEEKAGALADEAGRPDLALHPAYVEAALHSVRAARATPPEQRAEQVRNQGASLPTDAGASVSSSPSQEDQWWDNVKDAGGNAFPS